MEQNNYNINFNPKNLSSEEINQFKDFDALLEMHQATPVPSAKTPILRWLALGGGAVAATLIGFMFYFILLDNEHIPDDTLSADAYFASLPYVNPPIENLQSPMASFKISAHEGGVFEYETGSKLVFPKAAFVDDRGSLIQGEVEIKYREFHDFVDFFLSGIPMEYDSAGTRYQLESAGMLEIYAEQNGQRLFMNPEKEIKVELVSVINKSSENIEPNFNIYELDPDQRNWVYRGIDEIEIVEDLQAAAFSGQEESSAEEMLNTGLQELEQQRMVELQRIEDGLPKPTKPRRPERASEDAITFEFDFGALGSVSSINPDSEEALALDATKTEMDELRTQWEGTIWQVKDGEENKLDESVANIIWDEEKSKITSRGNGDFELRLTNGVKTITLLVQPVLSPDNYEKALNKFQNQFAQYEKQMVERESQLEAQKTALDQRIAEEKALLDQEYEQRIAFYQSKGRNDRATDLMIRQKIVNRFKVSNFGIWNCDRPLPPYIFLLEGEFVDNLKNNIQGLPAYLVNKNVNTITRFFASKGADIRFDNRQENLMWLITKENKLAIFSPEKFNEINDNRGNYTFVMDLQDTDISSEEELRSVLNFD